VTNQRASAVAAAGPIAPDLLPYLRLLELAGQQFAALEADDLDRYAALSDERESLVAHLPSPTDDRARGHARTLIARVREIDAAAQERLRASLEATRAELDQLLQGRRALRTYGHQSSVTSHQSSVVG
jgi:hypothetical protein